MDEKIRTTRKLEPHDRLTRLCAEMTAVLDREENRDVKAIVMLNDAERGGLQIHGYGTSPDSDLEAMTDLFIHLKAVFEANGKNLDIIAVPEVPDSPEGLDG